MTATAKKKALNTDDVCYNRQNCDESSATLATNVYLFKGIYILWLNDEEKSLPLW